MRMPRSGLTARIFFSSAGIVTLVLLVTLALTQRSANRAAESSIDRALRVTQRRVEELLASERGVLIGGLRAYGETPDFRSSLESAEPEYLDYAETAAEQSGAAWVQLIGRDGVRLAKSDDPSAPNVSVSGSLLVQRALDGDIAESYGIAGDSALVQYVAVPIRGGNNRILGALMAAKYVTDSVARAIGAQTQSDVLFFRLDTLGAPRLAAATDDLRPVSAALLDTLAGQLAGDSTGVELAGTAVPDSLTALRNSKEFELGGEHIVGRFTLLRSASADPVGGFFALRSLEKELRATGYTDLRRTLLFSGGGGLVLALLIAGITTRQVVRPVRRLADATRRAAEGDYASEIPEGGADEIGTLSSAFRRLLADLKDKQALVDFLSAASPAGTKTQAFSASSPTIELPRGDIKVLSPGQTFGNRYEIKSVLGVGGMGMVYKANDLELGETLAIKTLKPEMVAADSSALERFKSEIKLARRIAHRNVVRTYDLGEIGGQYYITMEYVEGKSLKDLIRERGRLPASVVLPIAKQLCRALEVSHDEGVIHRDIKPQNMVVQGDGVLKVMDFGIARLASRPAEGGHTQAGMVVGTPEYMAPEQLLGDELDVRADLYATGVVLYECLVGKVPHTADTPIALIAKVLEEEPRPPIAVHPDIPQALSELVLAALAKERAHRPSSAADLHTQLDQIILS
jgi:eukaryotic-like serine/threonine-protein kinase